MKTLIQMLALFSLIAIGCATEQAVVPQDDPVQAEQSKEADPGSFSSHFPEWMQ